MSASFRRRELSKGVDMKMRCQKARKFISLAMDGRLEGAAGKELAAHLDGCPACRAWQQEQSWLLDLVRTPHAMAPSRDFHAKVMARIATSSRRSPIFDLSRLFFRPVVLRAAMVLLLVGSAAMGFFLGAPLLDSAPDARAAAFNQTLNLDAFADLPADSFGAVYDRLLQGEIQ
jgi:predicted anti-sigma-YlaC factor YlaD